MDLIKKIQFAKNMERLARTNSSFLTSGVTSEIISMDPLKAEETPRNTNKRFWFGYEPESSSFSLF